MKHLDANNKYFEDLKDVTSFKKYGAQYTKVYADDQNHVYVFRKQWEGVAPYYEVIRGIKHRNPDNLDVFIYPNSSTWGKNGYDINSNCSNWKERIEYRVNQLRERAQENKIEKFKN